MTDVSITTRGLSVAFPLSGSRKPADGAAIDSGASRFVKGRHGLSLMALRDLDLDIAAGERVGVWGKNGSGKTTLLRTLRGVYPPVEGTIRVRGDVQSFFNISFGMNEDATGYENILIRGVMMGASPGEMRRRTEEIAAFSELGEFLNYPVRQYSAGMRMRLAFSVAATLPSDILLMDEWLSVGDFDFRKKVAERLRDVVRSSKILVIASHNRRILEAVCNRLIILKDGRIESDLKLGESQGEIPFFNPAANELSND
ncbi:ABC transporter ATP-binding protein [Maricaulis sp. CAU 1757]